MKENVKEVSPLGEISMKELLYGVCSHLLCAAVAFLLSRVSVAEGLVPFGISLIAACPKILLPGGVIGCVAGYMFPVTGIGMFRYIAACLAVLAIRVMCAAVTNLSKKVWFMSACALCVTLATGLVTLQSRQYAPLFAVLEAILSGAGAFFVHFAFSGNAKGEPRLAEYFATLPMSAFVLDYDHNAPSVEHLKETHQQFYKIIREKNPELPIILVSKPDTSIAGTDHQRRTVIMETFLNARKAGDDNIYFIDGYSFFPSDIRKDCTVDGCHPNDMGMHYMAKSIGGMLKEIFKIKNPQIEIEHIDF